MKKRQSKHSIKQTQRHRPEFSPAILEVARKRLQEFERQSDEGFLIRAEMDRRLHSL
ncbi:MAG: hypothetical protein JSR33_10105 [Proteobacteria bacterium]|nr:hypothetical protein [Pseudomonadota bacterium]